MKEKNTEHRSCHSALSRKCMTLILVFSLILGAPLTTAAQGFQLFGGSLNILGGFARLFTAYDPTPLPVDPNPYVEDVFSTYLYTGNGSTQNINNGINLATHGGLVWGKNRSSATDHWLYDTVRGDERPLTTNNTNSQADNSGGALGVTAFNSSGFTLGATDVGSRWNAASNNYTTWTFREAPGFFDIVTYTGNGTAPRAISHSLGQTPGLIIIKRTDSTGDWWVYHRSAPNQGAAYAGIGGNMYLNYTDAADTGTNPALSAVDSTTFTLSTNQNAVTNVNGATYVAYLFAHDTSTDGIIQAGSFTTNASGNATTTLGWEPQFLMIKAADATDNWRIEDTTRGLSLTGYSTLLANSSDAETSSSNSTRTLTPTGFVLSSQSVSTTYVYLAIRKGPMKTPTDGTDVYSAIARTGTGDVANITGVGFTPDLLINAQRTHDSSSVTLVWDRLRGAKTRLYTNTTAAEGAETAAVTSLDMDGATVGLDVLVNGSSKTYINWFFRRTPWVFDVVAYTGTGSGQNVSHNLGVAPELIIVKKRSGATWWGVWFDGGKTAFGLDSTIKPVLDNAAYDGHTSTYIETNKIYEGNSSGNAMNASGDTYIAYLFASKPLVSKVGSYTGNGSTQNIDASFSQTARFIMIKRTDSTGDWYVWDSERGIVSGNDPHLSLNGTAAEVTTDDSIDPYSLGFAVNQDAATNINVNGATYIYLAFQ